MSFALWMNVFKVLVVTMGADRIQLSTWQDKALVMDSVHTTFKASQVMALQEDAGLVCAKSCGFKVTRERWSVLRGICKVRSGLEWVANGDSAQQSPDSTVGHDLPSRRHPWRDAILFGQATSCKIPPPKEKLSHITAVRMSLAWKATMFGIVWCDGGQPTLQLEVRECYSH